MPLLSARRSDRGFAEPAREAAQAAGAGSRSSTLAFAAFVPPLVGYVALVVLLALVTALAGGGFSVVTALAAAGPAWLAACHVPLSIAGSSLGVLPLLPCVMVLTLAAVVARWAARRIGAVRPADAVPVLATVTVAHAAVGLIIAVSCASGQVSAAPALAFFGAAACGLLGALAGLVRRCGLLAVVTCRADAVVLRGLRAGVLAIAGLIAVGSLVYALGELASIDQGVTLFDAIAPGIGSGFGLWLLCLAYLPNALIGGISFALGSGVNVGAVAVSPLSYHGGALPAFPLLAAIPDGPRAWWPVLFVLPLAVGVVVGRWVRREVDSRGERLRAVGVAALLVAAVFLVLAAVAGGAIGGGPASGVRIPAGLLALTAGGWIAVPGGLLACWRRGEGAAALSEPDGFDPPDGGWDHRAAPDLDARDARADRQDQEDQDRPDDPDEQYGAYDSNEPPDGNASDEPGEPAQPRVEPVGEPGEDTP